MRGRAMIRPLLKAQVASVVIGLTAPFMHGWAELVAWRGGEWLSWGSIAGFGVVLVWNVLHPDLEAREEREMVLEEAREHKRMIMERAAVAAMTGWDRAVLDAQRAGTFSLNGVRQPGTTLRYVGPPALYTPSKGFEVMLTVELHAEPRVCACHGQPEPGPAPVTRRHAAECDVCGVPMDVALVLPGYPYLCQGCLAEAHALKYLFR